jgi:hypothetical protein
MLAGGIIIMGGITAGEGTKALAGEAATELNCALWPSGVLLKYVAAGDGATGVYVDAEVPKSGTLAATGCGDNVPSELAAEVTSLGGGAYGSGLFLLGVAAITCGGGGIVPMTGDVTAPGIMGTTAGMTVVLAPISIGLFCIDAADCPGRGGGAIASTGILWR